MKYAIVGSGASAFGVILGLLEHITHDDVIHIYDGNFSTPPVGSLGSHNSTINDIYSSAYTRLRSSNFFRFPPPKSFFGFEVSKHPISRKPTLWNSRIFGGLTLLWGGGFLPFTDKELDDWPISYSDLYPFYQLVSRSVPISGVSDGLDCISPPEFLNCPPIPQQKSLLRLFHLINDNTCSSYRFFAGTSRLALYSSKSHARRSLFDGQDMVGSYNGSVWSARNEIEQFRSDPRIHFIDSSVQSFTHLNQLKLIPKSSISKPKLTSPYDKIYLAAGAIGTGQILLNSTPNVKSTTILDNSVSSFLIFNFTPVSDLSHYFGLSNGSVIVDQIDNQSRALISIYPFFDHLLRFYIPNFLWPIFKPIANFLRWRILITRMTTSGEDNHSFTLTSPQPESSPLLTRLSVGSSSTTNSIYHVFKSMLKGTGFVLPLRSSIPQKTSSHYSSSCPMVSVSPQSPALTCTPDGLYKPGVYVADASSFPSCPAISPTFTIIANASRIASLSVS